MSQEKREDLIASMIEGAKALYDMFGEPDFDT